jgi:hypothetical protein
MSRLRFPRAMPHWCYLDPALIGENKLITQSAVPHETLTSAPVQMRAPKDRHYTQARRLHIKALTLSKGKP